MPREYIACRGGDDNESVVEFLNAIRNEFNSELDEKKKHCQNEFSRTRT